MNPLYKVLAVKVAEWKSAGYPCPDYPVIAEILKYQIIADEEVAPQLRFIRAPQLKALETYWYLRLIEKTPKISELYQSLLDRKLYSKKLELVEALGVPQAAYNDVDNDLAELLKSVASDDAFVQKYKLEALRETLTLDYPSYILALAMGAGKTVLIGAIIATEFAMALEYPTGNFIQNALVFAPGKTILESALPELARMSYDLILPPRLYIQFASNLKLTFTRDGEKNVPVIPNSSFNVVVTNTEKIRIQKETIRKSDFTGLFASLNKTRKEDEIKTEVANLRLQTLANLPNLGIFSDEAHHTYGQNLSMELKKVRKTVNYLAAKTNLICVVNTTGTPYFENQPLKDVVVWYGLAEGIRDNILKEVKQGVQAYKFDEASTAAFVSEVVRDFFEHYRNVRLPSGAWAKLAIYFPQNDDLEELRPTVETTLASLGYDPAIVVRNTSLATKDEIDAFYRLNDPTTPHRVILLVNKGTEGWNCPSLFACALARKLTNSSNFVLQAATRCLRQVTGNNVPARIYLSDANRATLDNQLRQSFGETLESLEVTASVGKSVTLTLRKKNVAPLFLTIPVTTVQRKDGVQATMLDFQLVRPDLRQASFERTVYSIEVESQAKSALNPQQIPQQLELQSSIIDCFAAAADLAERYNLDLLVVQAALLRLYPDGEIPSDHLDGDDPDTLARQLERQYCDFEQQTHFVQVTLALVKLNGWRDKSDGYSTNVNVPASKEHLLADLRAIEDNPRDFGYHYAPYYFSSKPELDFFVYLLTYLKNNPGDIEDVYFTGGITSEKKTDFFIEYTDFEGVYHRYIPDFIIRKNPRKDELAGSGPSLIVEIKSSQQRATIEAEMAAHDEAAARTDEARKAYAALRWVNLNRLHERLDYALIFDNDSPLLSQKVKDFLDRKPQEKI